MPGKTIKAMIAEINDEDADGGGLWLPNIQRLFVWEEDQIEKLFDSIMRQYPLSSMLLWKTKEKVRTRRFIVGFYDKGTNLKDLYVPYNKKVKRFVLDGQQRLQSLFFGLKGSIEGRFLHFDVLSGQAEVVDDEKYRFAFKPESQSVLPWVRFSELIYSKKLPDEIVVEQTKNASIELSDYDRHIMIRNIGRAQKEFGTEPAIVYQEIDGTDQDNNYTFDDVVEIFIRANSGGTKLNKSDLMFTLLTTQWDVADIEMEEFLVEINDNRFAFTRDFVIKVAMSVLDYGSKYDVDKLRKEEVRTNIADNWKKITNAIRFVRDEVTTKTFIRSDKALTSYNALIPLIYFRFHQPKDWGQGRFVKDYFLRVLLGGAFSRHPDGLIDKLTKEIQNSKDFNKKRIFSIIKDEGRNLSISKSSLDNMGYGSGFIHLLFNLWYDTSYRPAFDGYLPQIDHIFARSLLHDEKIENPKTGRKVQRYSAWEINQLANCMLLTSIENGSGDKSDKPLSEWLKDKNDEFLELHCIPPTKSLWKIENYEKFIEARKILIYKKFSEFIHSEDEE